MEPVVAFVWSNFGPYHVDRLEAAAEALKDTHSVIGIEIAGATEVYGWERAEKVYGFERITLFPDQQFESIAVGRTIVALMRAIMRVQPQCVFLCHYERIDIYLAAWLLRALGVEVYLMTELKFDDKPRFAGRELLKKIFLLPYGGALVGGERTRDYLQFFGFDLEKIHYGYDTVSIERIRRLAGSAPAPSGADFGSRHFSIVARLVPKKNIFAALTAYSKYCTAVGPAARELHICGSGELEDELRDAVKQLSLASVVFHGFVQSAEVARVLSSTVALILPSVEEQWGLVINEALAMGVPILCSLNAGARDRLVRTAVNGYIFEPNNSEGLARLLCRLGSEEGEWRRLAEGSLGLARLADTAEFGAGVREALVKERTKRHRLDAL